MDIISFHVLFGFPDESKELLWKDSDGTSMSALFLWRCHLRIFSFITFPELFCNVREGKEKSWSKSRRLVPISFERLFSWSMLGSSMERWSLTRASCTHLFCARSSSDRTCDDLLRSVLSVRNSWTTTEPFSGLIGKSLWNGSGKFRQAVSVLLFFIRRLSVNSFPVQTYAGICIIFLIYFSYEQANPRLVRVVLMVTWAPMEREGKVLRVLPSDTDAASKLIGGQTLKQHPSDLDS